MAIFSRRTLQRLINENACFLKKPGQTKDHVDELNNGKLDFEWEVVLLNVFSKLGKVKHEPNLPDSKKEIDILFTSADESFEFLAEIKTISDEGVEISNPQKQFSERLCKEIKENNLVGEWHYSIGSDYEEESVYSEPEKGFDQKGNKVITRLGILEAVNSKCKLKLPALSRFDTEIFNQDFEEFLNRIKNLPKESHDYKISTDTIDIKIKYSPSERSILLGNFANYKQANNWTYSGQNTIYSKLEEKSQNQLKQSGYNGTLGIILCDGGTDFLRKSKHVFREFLKNHPYINFILAFDVEQSDGQIKVYFEKGQVLNRKIENFLSNFHKYSSDVFPFPIRNARNAVRAAENFNQNNLNNYYKGTKMEMGGGKITISSRKILEFLAGSRKDLSNDEKKYFEDMLKEGKLITKIEVESDPENDDDSLIFRFGEPDVSISPFKVPNTKK